MVEVLIADDEPLMRAELRDYVLRLWPEARVVAEACNGAEAVELTARLKPKVVFLDIEMPTMDGLQAAKFIAESAHVVFVTAFNEHALKAFDLGAVDYVLKPIDAGRLYLTLNRVKKRIAEAPSTQAVVAVSEQIQSTRRQEHLTWIFASAGNSTRLITVEEVMYFQADAKCTKVAIGDGTDAIIRKPIKELVEELNPDHFIQIHRSAVINLRCVDRVFRDGDGHMEVTMRGRAERLPVSKAYQPAFRAM